MCGWLRRTTTLFAGRIVVPVALVVCTGARVAAQSASGPSSDASGITLPQSAFRVLPSSGTLGGLLETVIPEMISDRIEGGGLSVGSDSRLGARGSSWTQTAFQFADLDFTDPGGGSLLFLDPSMLDAVETVTALMPVDVSAPGLVVRLTPRRPSEKWERRLEFMSTVSAQPLSAAPVPPISTLHTWSRLAASASGPLLGNRVRATMGVSAASATGFERADPTLLRSHDNSGFAHILFTPSGNDELSGTVVGRSARAPFDGRLWIERPEARLSVSDLLMESRWEHRTRSVVLTTVGGFWRFTASPDTVSSSLAYIDSIRDMPIADAVSAGETRHRWSTGLRAAGRPGVSNRFLRGGQAGFEIGGASLASESLLAPTVAETVEGFPARVWRFTGATSHRHATTATVYAGETIPLNSRLTVDGGVRWETVAAAADSGPSIDWNHWSPRLSVRWNIVSSDRLAGILGLSRYGHRLPLNDLRYADPNAPSADVFRWNDLNGNGRFDTGEQGALISRVGARPAGTSEIDPQLQRPYLDEFLLGLEARPSGAWTLRLVGLTRRERQLIDVVNAGAPSSAYTVVTIADPGGDLLDPADDQRLPIYNRRPETFGADHYVLTNPAGHSARSQGVELNVGYRGDRLWMIAGATANRSAGPAAARGFRVFQNDDATTGDALENPNSGTFAHGALFSNRGYTIKTSGAYRFTHDVTLGIVARYQDGQPFARLVLAPGLNQGTEAIRAYINGRTRFTYTLTVDSRVLIPLTVAKRRVDLVWDVFNLVNMKNEVEEFVVTGPSFRASTATQPRRTTHLGLRLAF